MHETCHGKGSAVRECRTVGGFRGWRKWQSVNSIALFFLLNDSYRRVKLTLTTTTMKNVKDKKEKGKPSNNSNINKRVTVHTTSTKFDQKKIQLQLLQQNTFL